MAHQGEQKGVDILPVPIDAGDAESMKQKTGTTGTVTYVAGAHETAGLRRALNGRHTYMISLASGIGTGLFVSRFVLSLTLSLPDTDSLDLARPCT